MLQVQKDKLLKTIFYNLNSIDIEVLEFQAITFMGGGIPGKIKYGPECFIRSVDRKL